MKSLSFLNDLEKGREITMLNLKVPQSKNLMRSDGKRRKLKKVWGNPHFHPSWDSRKKGSHDPVMRVGVL